MRIWARACDSSLLKIFFLHFELYQVELVKEFTDILNLEPIFAEQKIGSLRQTLT